MLRVWQLPDTHPTIDIDLLGVTSNEEAEITGQIREILSIQVELRLHLRVLKDARLVLDEAVGNQRIYRLNPSGIEEIRAYFDRFWDDALSSFKTSVEIDHPPKKEKTRDATNQRIPRRSKENPRKR